MDLPNTESVSIKTEPGSQEGNECDLPYTKIDIDIQDVKKECLEYSANVDRMAEFIQEQTSTGRESYPASHKDDTLKKRISKTLFCSRCQYSCSGKQDLKTHMLTHSGERFMCPECNNSFSSKGSLKRHMVMHSEIIKEKSFTCPEYNRTLSRKSDLKNHMLTHSGQKPFTCSKCNFSSLWKNSLKYHMLTHSDEKRFTCPEYDYSCVLKHNLRVHMIMHSSEKPFACSECNYSCVRKYNLKRHLRRNHSYVSDVIIHVPQGNKYKYTF